MWYEQYARLLPWRDTDDPYKIWVSEIILQQTQVVQGQAYYERFCEQFPSVEILAKTSLDQVMKSWEGLGYYSRCRNLHQAAKDIVNMGEFPKDYTRIRQLKGVGDYTAAAIASFAFGLPYPVLDGNVARFGSRYFGIREAMDHKEGKTRLMHLLEKAMPRDQAALFNQAIMEFGALHCKKNQPKCPSCPFRLSCQAYALDIVDLLPSKRSITRVRSRFMDYYVLCTPPHTILVRQRLHADIWRGLYDFPSIENDHEPPQPLEGAIMIEEFTHKLSHRNLHIRVFVLQHKPSKTREPFQEWIRDYQWLSLTTAKNLAFPKALFKTLDALEGLTFFKHSDIPISNS